MRPSLVPLRNVAALVSLIESVQNRVEGLPGMATFYGPSGWGKTSAVTIAANTYQAHFVEVKSCWTPTYFLQKIMRDIGAQPVRGIPAMVDVIGNYLAITGRILIIDDAQYLMRMKMIEYVRDIYESCGTPVIFVAEETFPQDLTRWENIHGRQYDWVGAEPCSLSDAGKLAPIYCAGVNVDPSLLAAIVDASAGAHRYVATNLAKVQELARQKGTKHADLEFWGDRTFNRGQPPAVRKVGDLRVVGESRAASRRVG